ncbi:MAG: FAD-dependent oxidoreductase [Armatimonadetes bacterium]|nr:FAD-dependent oxidoreductase [Armatimonadota bacterium]
MNRTRLTPHPMDLPPGLTSIREAVRETPVRATCDVLVVGGGPAGVGAALAAAQTGADALLVERYGMLGGMWTAGLVNPFFEATRNGWIVTQIVRRLEEAGAWMPWRWAYTFDPETMRRELERLMSEAGVRLLYHCLCVDSIVEGNRVRGVVIESKAGREALLANVVVDCTGDGDVAARAGAPFEFGRLGDGLVQPMTLMFEIDGTGDFAQDSAAALFDAMAQAIEEHNLGVELPFGRANYVPWLIALPAAGTAAVQLTHVYRLNPLDPADLTAGTIDARRQAAEAVKILRHVPGLQGVRLRRTAAQIGVRETRRILGAYQLSLDDLAAGRRFPDGIASCAFGVDIHEPAPGAGVPSGHGATMQPYEIPYRCLLPADLLNLLVAGRCISGTHEAHASYRVTGTCVATGQAAGLAAALSSARNLPPSQLSGPSLRAALIHLGVALP